jgi:sigma-E factor negative regulatory protein RseA
MNAINMTNEQLSAFADGELADSQLDMVLAALRQTEGKAAWDTYHQIGDVLRSDEMAITLSADFAVRMAARLDAEPTIIAPVVKLPRPEVTWTSADLSIANRGIKRFAMPGMAAAAVAAFAFFSAPQLMVALNGNGRGTAPTTMVASGSSSLAPQNAIVAASDQNETVLRDPRIDDYLLAHQRFSPSLYSTAQYARSATFATESDK